MEPKVLFGGIGEISGEEEYRAVKVFMVKWKTGLGNKEIGY